MLNTAICNQLKPVFEKMQETAFDNLIQKVEDLPAAIGSGKFNQTIKISTQWVISVALTISPDDTDQHHFWHGSVAYINSLSHKPKSTFLWTDRENKVAQDILKLLMDIDDGYKNIEIKKLKVGLHGYKTFLL